MKILSVFGTRPEAIKMAPICLALNSDERFHHHICVTAQHREMLDQILSVFSLTPKYDLNLMSQNQSLEHIVYKVMVGLEKILKDFRPDYVLVHGDTSTSFAAALASFYQKIPVVHIEAGLRTNNLFSPWPEEANRRLTAVLAKYHIAATKLNRENLLRENVDSQKIFVTGNTVVDALKIAREIIKQDYKKRAEFDNILKSITNGAPYILITGHRRESFGGGFQKICEAIVKLSKKYSEVYFIYPVHLNPSVKNIVHEWLDGYTNICLLQPQEYLCFIYFMLNSYLILTDSGGIQEEAIALSKPVIVMRDTTERPEAISAGGAKLVGTDTNLIIKEVSKLLDDSEHYGNMCKTTNPYGDGDAAKRILNILFYKESKVNSLGKE